MCILSDVTAVCKSGECVSSFITNLLCHQLHTGGVFAVEITLSAGDSGDIRHTPLPVESTGKFYWDAGWPGRHISLDSCGRVRQGPPGHSVSFS